MGVTAVDSEYLFRESHEEFLGSNIFYYRDTDITPWFGVLKHLFVIEKIFQQTVTCLIIGSDVIEQYRLSEYLFNILEKTGIKKVVGESSDTMSILQSISGSLTHIVSRRKKLLQMVNAHTSVFLPNKDKLLVKYTEAKVLKEFGITPNFIPTYMALTEGNKLSRLTKRQSQRLICQYGDMKNILVHLPNISDQKVVSKLLSNRQTLINLFNRFTISYTNNNVYKTVVADLLSQPRNINNSVLTKLGFHSLTRPLNIAHISTIVKKENITNKTVLYSWISPEQDNKLRELSKAINEAGICSIDTESSDKNPQLAELYGVSFSIREGEAFYIPFVDKNTKAIDNRKSRKWLKHILADRNIKFVGHNIKYDCLLLKRYGFTINNVYFDTMLAAHELFGDLASFSLSSLVKKYLHFNVLEYKDLVKKDNTLIDIPFSTLINYTCEHADATLQLYHLLDKKLAKNKIRVQFFKSTMPKVMQFGEIEHNGIRISGRQLTTIRRRIVERMERLSKEVYDLCGEHFDIDLNTEISRVLLNHLQLKNYGKKLKESFVIQLAKHYVEPRLILSYKREKRILKKLDQLAGSSNSSKVYPVFNLIKSPIGLVEGEKPDLLTSMEDINMSEALVPNNFIVVRSMNDIINRISDLTGYQNLENGLKNRENDVLALIDNREDVNIRRLFVHICIGYSDHHIANEFYVVQRRISEIKYKMKEWFSRVFKWIDNYKHTAILNGYAELHGQKKFLYGLNSSNMAKKEMALQNIIRWAIRY